MYYFPNTTKIPGGSRSPGSRVEAFVLVVACFSYMYFFLLHKFWKRVFSSFSAGLDIQGLTLEERLKQEQTTGLNATKQCLHRKWLHNGIWTHNSYFQTKISLVSAFQQVHFMNSQTCIFNNHSKQQQKCTDVEKEELLKQKGSSFKEQIIVEFEHQRQFNLKYPSAWIGFKGWIFKWVTTGFPQFLTSRSKTWSL